MRDPVPPSLTRDDSRRIRHVFAQRGQAFGIAEGLLGGRNATQQAGVAL